MAYIGRSVDIGMFEKQVLTPNSSTTTFNLNFAVGAANSLLVVYGGVIQEPNVAYSVSGGGQQIVFSEAPVTGTTLYIIYLGKQLTTPRAAGQETTKQTFTGNGTTTVFTLADAPVVPSGIMVFVDGILQREGAGGNYVSSGSTIAFDGAPDSGAEIDVYTLVKEKVSIDTVADGSITRAKLAQSAPYWDASGKVGINTPTPTRLLHITGAGASGVSASNPSIRLDNTATGRFGLIELSSDANMYIWNADAGAGSTVFMRGAGSGTESARIDSLGNVGINKNSPSSKLHISGSSGVNGAAITLDIGAQQHAWYLADSFTGVYSVGSASASSTYKWLYNSTVEMGRVNPYGFGVGGAIPSSGAGIAFPATQVASSDPNTLDDYEEGSIANLTIQGVGSVSGQSYATQLARYTKVGNIVTVSFDLRLLALGTNSGAIVIAGLPFPGYTGDYYGGGSINYFQGLNSSWTCLNMYMVPGATYAYITGVKSAASTTMSTLTASDLTNSTWMWGTLVYQTAT